MPNNQNPVFTDNATVNGDGTSENPLSIGGDSSGNFELNVPGQLDLNGNGVSIESQTGSDITLTADQRVSITGGAEIFIQANTSKVRVTPLLSIADIQTFANNAAAITGGLVAGDVYTVGGDPATLAIVT